VKQLQGYSGRELGKIRKFSLYLRPEILVPLKFRRQEGENP
jgi:hypothetical protein